MLRLYLECGSVGGPRRAIHLPKHRVEGPYLRERARQRWRTVQRGCAGAFSEQPLLHRRGGLPGRDPSWRTSAHHRRPTFDAVQAKLADNARARRVCVESSPAILMGRLFDDRGNRMTPSHSNKDGVRYRYYVSHVLLQRRKNDAGRVTRVPAIALEKLVVGALRARLSRTRSRPVRAVVSFRQGVGGRASSTIVSRATSRIAYPLTAFFFGVAVISMA
jgi:hypothetical protein